MLATGVGSGNAWAAYAPNQVVVTFKPDVVAIPSSNEAEPLGEYEFAAPSIFDVLSSLGATHMRRLFPEFTHESVYTVSVTGDSIVLPHDLTDVYVVTLADTNVTEATLSLQGDSNIAVAEPDYIGSTDYVPNDSLFAEQWWLLNSGQYGGVTGEDSRAEAAWNLVTGAETTIRVGVIDTGIDIAGSGHPDLPGVAAGVYMIADGPGGPPQDLDQVSHGTAVAGIIGARGNNREGLTGVNWRAELVPIKVSEQGGIQQTDVADALDWARQNNIRIVNMSLSWTEAPVVLRMAIKNGATAGILQVAAMGNTGGSESRYPARLPYFTEAVGAVTNDGNRWTNVDIGCGSTGGSNTGDWIDIVAPGGKGIATTRSRATGSYYTVSNKCDGFGGTSAAAPVVSGVASLVASRAPVLDGQDLSEVLHRTARDRTIYGNGWDTSTGWGVVDADSAFKFVSGQRQILRGTATSVYQYGQPTTVQLSIVDAPCVPGTNFGSLRYEMRANVTFSPPFYSAPDVWGRFSGSVGWNDDNPHVETSEPVGWAGVVPGSITTTGCVLYTYIYDVKGSFGQHIGWCPTTTANARMSWTAIGDARPLPDVSQSFYVPQRGSYTSPIEGSGAFGAVSVFHTCPNNDGNSLGDKARIKVVARDASGNPIPGIAATDIFLRLNRGTSTLPPAGQGFRGPGADSIISNQLYSAGGGCPDVEFIYADGPTDAAGVAYITFTGAGGTRSALRKWGHYDSEIPVYVYWKKLQGRLTTGSPAASYVLQIKNADVTGGLAGILNQGEAVNSTDFNSISSHLNEQDSADPMNWWRDLDSNGSINTSDYQIVVNHLGHTCSVPNSQ